MKIPAVNVHDCYPIILQRFHRELQYVQQEYNTNKKSPPLARNLPPIASRIAWCRQLYQKISQPVKQFHELPGLLEQSDTRNMIKGYNRLAQVLVEYEIIHLRQWREKMNAAKHSLTSTLLIRDPLSKALLVNFDPQINEFLREIQVLSGMGIEIPEDAITLYTRKTTILSNYNIMKVS